MKVVEKFTSINGEGTRAGELAVFIRFKGCNLRCSYCDTMWANEPECPYKEETSFFFIWALRFISPHSITITTSQVAPFKTDKNCKFSCTRAFPINTGKLFYYFHLLFLIDCTIIRCLIYFHIMNSIP